MQHKTLCAITAAAALLTGSVQLQAAPFYTTGVGWAEFNPQANQRARQMARERCQNLSGSVQSYQVTSSEQVTFSDSNQYVGGTAWIVHVRATCVVLP